MKRCRQNVCANQRGGQRSASIPERPKTADVNGARRHAGRILLTAGCTPKKCLSSNYISSIRFHPCIQHNTGYFNCPQGTPQMQFPETSSRRRIWPTEVILKHFKKRAQEETGRAQRSVDPGSDYGAQNVACCGCPTTDFTMSWCPCHNTFTMWKMSERKGVWKSLNKQLLFHPENDVTAGRKHQGQQWRTDNPQIIQIFYSYPQSARCHSKMSYFQGCIKGVLNVCALSW